MVLLTTSACSLVTESGSAAVVGSTDISESVIQEQSNGFINEALQGTATDVQRAQLNRTQLTFQVRHQVIARAAQAAGITLDQAQINTAQTQLAAQGVAKSMGLQAADLPILAQDYLLLGQIASRQPATGAKVVNISVNAEGVAVASRDEAVAKLSTYLADPAKLTADVAAAGQSGLTSQKYNLLAQPTAGAFGLYRAGTGSYVILPNNTGYLLLRVSGRTSSTATLTAETLQSAQSASDFFDLAVLLLPPDDQVSVNPRFGVWDPASLQVVPPNDGL